MLHTKANSGYCACWMTGSGSLAWLLRCRGQLAVVSNASNMRVSMPKPLCNWLLLPHIWSCCMLTLPALRQWWSWINPQMWWIFWTFVAILWNMSWHTWPLIRLWKLLLSSNGRDTSQSLEHQPSSWVTEGTTLKATASESFVSLWAYRRLGLCLTMLKPMER